MALRKIVKIGDNKLRKICKPVEKFDRRLKILLEDMADTMYDANGVGLVAPQVGILRRAVVIDVGDGLVELVNPVIVESDGQQSGPEGCLSIPGRSGVVTRPNHVKVRAQDPENGKSAGAGVLRRAVCAAELDHLDGVLYVDKMDREILEATGITEAEWTGDEEEDGE
ncbi:MAG: peptide deformylase [Lachnospiraceae bacterium]